MNPIAQRALDRARQSTAPGPTATVQHAPPLPELVITGPINRVMELEGKRYALTLVQALGAPIRKEPVRTKAIGDLTRYAVTQPSSVASGVKIVIDMLKGAS